MAGCVRTGNAPDADSARQEHYTSPKQAPFPAQKPGNSGQSAATERIRLAAASLATGSDRERLENGLRFLITEFAYDPAYNAAQYTRTADGLFRERVLGGCSDYALAALALFRAMGYECNLVVTANGGWMERYRHSPVASILGHSFLEIRMGGRWILADPNHYTAYDGYDPNAPDFPRREVFVARGWDFWDLGIRDKEDLLALLAPVAESTTLPVPDESPHAMFTVGLDLPRVFVSLGDVLFRQRDYWLALRRYDRALELAPSYAPARVHRARLAMKTGDFSGAASDLTQALESGHETGLAHYMRAQARDEQGRTGLVETDLSRAAALGLDMGAVSPYVRFAGSFWEGVFPLQRFQNLKTGQNPGQ